MYGTATIGKLQQKSRFAENTQNPLTLTVVAPILANPSRVRTDDRARYKKRRVVGCNPKRSFVLSTTAITRILVTNTLQSSVNVLGIVSIRMIIFDANC